MRAVHTKCPIGHPERYLYSRSQTAISDDMIVNFWKWCRDVHGFRGIVNWSSYEEPGHSLKRVLELQKRIKKEDPDQPFQLITSLPELADSADFDIVKFSDYDGGKSLDDRIKTREGEGKPYAQMPRRSQCRRGMGWEIVIDNWGNWMLCCVDWRNEESFGSICNTDWEVLFQRWKEKAATIRWRNEAEYNALPRMCRSCLDILPAIAFP